MEKRPKNVLKTSQSDIHSVASLGRSQDVNLIITYKKMFLRKLFYISQLQVYIRLWKPK